MKITIDILYANLHFQNLIAIFIATSRSKDLQVHSISQSSTQAPPN